MKRKRLSYLLSSIPFVFSDQISIAPRIINGTPAAKDAYPWFVSLDGKCGGMLIHKEFVLTAAHCEPSLFGSNEVTVGQLCVDQSDNCGQKQETIKVKNIIPHPLYTALTTAPSYDYLLLHLENPSTIDPVAFDDGSYSSTYTSTTVLKTCGFGYTKNSAFGPSTVSSELMETSLYYVKQSECRSQYLLQADITSSMMCAYAEGTDACQGDSGGPLYDEQNKVVVGIVSWGYGCAQGKPGVYSRISYEYQWIRQTICENIHSGIRPAYCIGMPTASPTISPAPTAAPTPCVGMRARLNLRTDDFSFETSWFIYEMETHEVIDSVTLYEEPNSLSSHDLCLSNSKCYNFIILDSFGDGFLLPGGYELITDDTTLISGNNFGFMDTKTFGSCEQCDPFQVSLTIDTDSNGEETFWVIREVQSQDIYYSGGFEISYEDGISYDLEYNLCRNKCYQFEIYDLYGDGIDSPGKAVLSSPYGTFETSDFGFVDYYIFGEACGCLTDEMRVSMDVFIEGDSKMSWVFFHSDSNGIVMNGVFDNTTTKSFCLPKNCYTVSVYDEAELSLTEYNDEASRFRMILKVDGRDILEINNQRSIEEFGTCQTSGSSSKVFKKWIISGTLITSWVISQILM